MTANDVENIESKDQIVDANNAGATEVEGGADQNQEPVVVNEVAQWIKWTNEVAAVPPKSIQQINKHTNVPANQIFIHEIWNQTTILRM